MSTQPMRNERAAKAIELTRPARYANAGSIVGQVLDCAEGVYRVRSGNGIFQASRAASCLLDVAAGDTVHCLHLSADQAWILDVLDRADDSARAVRLPTRTTLEAQDGQLRLQAAELVLKSRSLKVESEESVFVSAGTEVIGERFRVVGHSFKLIGKIFHGVMERATHFSQSYLRTTQGLDRVQATTLDMSAKQLLRASGEHTLFEGEKLVKTRGAQIHFG